MERPRNVTVTLRGLCGYAGRKRGFGASGTVDTMGVHVVVVYRPKPGRSEDVVNEVRRHVPELRRLGLATDETSLCLSAADGSIVEHFEWVSHEAMRSAHENADVQAMWKRFEACCDYGTLGGLPNAGALFAEFELLGRF